MKKICVLLVLFFFICSCSEKKENNGKIDPIAYVTNPAKTDILCISEIDKAKAEIAKEGVVFIQTVGLFYGHLRYENELQTLCKEKGLKYDVEVMSCVVFEDQTQGCYGAYMDKVLADKYGANFKNHMHKKADSVFLKNVVENDIAVKQWNCDIKPKLPTENERSSNFSPYVEVKKVKVKEGDTEYNDYPFFDLGFIVHRDSTISGFYSDHFVSNFKENEIIQNQLYEIAVKYVKDNYPIWIPGIINGVPVKTDHNVRLYFKNYIPE